MRYHCATMAHLLFLYHATLDARAIGVYLCSTGSRSWVVLHGRFACLLEIHSMLTIGY